jgi:hypothetical protein
LLWPTGLRSFPQKLPTVARRNALQFATGKFRVASRHPFGCERTADSAIWNQRSRNIVAALAALGHDIGRAPRKGFRPGCLLAAAKAGPFWSWALLGTLSDLRHDQRQRGKPGRDSGLSGSPNSAPPRLTDFPCAPGARRRQSAALLSRFAA